jgi:hypothetical protein
MSKSFDVPQAVQREAQRGLDLRKEHGRGGLSTQQAGKHGIGSGVQRAVDLVQGRVTYQTVKRMLAFFNRHKAYKEHHTMNPPSNSLISWKLWGGDAGYKWAQRIVREEENVQKGSFTALALGLNDDDDVIIEEAPPSSFQELLTRAKQQEQEEVLSVVTPAEAEKMHADDPMFAPPSSKPFTKSLPDEDEDEEDADDTLDAIRYVPHLVLPPDLKAHIKKALKRRRSTGQGSTEAKRVAQYLHRGKYAQVQLCTLERLLDGLGSDDEQDQADAQLIGGYLMFDAICKAQPHVPAKYLEGLTGEAREKRKKQIQARIKGKESYKELEGDEDVKTKPSKYTKTKLAAAVRDEIKSAGKAEFLRAAAKVGKAPKKILEEVYDRGLKAWSTSGHRVGASAQQWAKARVYSFLTGGKTTRTGDKDLFEDWKSKD